ncbi:uncharacterized protein A1O9_11193 [Exophiala aquamarina CBS 119918]|uniref:T cell CD4 receptor C-terminal region domain-containing protein n=1 Tax=Exophiala aquamarina CBS 119918 TaxID=1182545 RepID=A0A072NYZ9_9EURO|nr:uncharacterized protein A1O9_11193 [Exophiala aquamarina CBS 119918]KEF52776.1 hypothetical protein A1O9_11193 [Exophiala aquamarina CBS 119918]
MRSVGSLAPEATCALNLIPSSTLNMSTYFSALLKRAECKNNDPAFDACETYVSDFTKTGIPLIIGLSLLFLAGTVMFFIVRRQRRRQRAAELAKEREIDDNMELTWVPIPKSNENSNWQAPLNYEDPSKPPPSYSQEYPPRTQQKDRGRRASRDSDYA